MKSIHARLAGAPLGWAVQMKAGPWRRWWVGCRLLWAAELMQNCCSCRFADLHAAPPPAPRPSSTMGTVRRLRLENLMSLL